MQYTTFAFDDVAVEGTASSFISEHGAAEYHIMLHPIQYGSSSDQMSAVERAYSMALKQLGLLPETAVWRRIFASDLINQKAAWMGSELVAPTVDNPCAVSLVEQQPLPDKKLVLWAYHVAGEGSQKWSDGESLVVQRNGLQHVLSTGLSAPELSTAYEQSRDVFSQLGAILNANSMTLLDNVLRTWIFVQNVDADYHGLVVGRREYFTEHGLTPETHFVASTGIEGAHDDPRTKVMMDVYSVRGIDPEQISFIEALDHLNPTHEYGVTFERATAVQYGDRRHVIVSGTASIDKHGQIVHVGDVARQLDRAMENIDALLQNAAASMDDITYLVVYLRDQSDYAITCETMRRRYGDVPMAVVVGPVCRPGWLVEVECAAVTSQSDTRFPPF